MMPSSAIPGKEKRRKRVVAVRGKASHYRSERGSTLGLKQRTTCRLAERGRDFLRRGDF